VSPEHWRKGIGHELMAAAINWFKSQGYPEPPCGSLRRTIRLARSTRKRAGSWTEPESRQNGAGGQCPM
jgi:GNAT superfamily N-acetyltransferase